MRKFWDNSGSGRPSAVEGARSTSVVPSVLGIGSVTISPAVLAWHDSIVVRLAEAAYEERQLPAGTLDSGRLSILADAMEEAGCTDTDILGHLRGPGPHVRGCWVVDLVRSVD